jgi:hypothetical protein
MSKCTYKVVKYRTVGTALFIVYLIYNCSTCFSAVSFIPWLLTVTVFRQTTLDATHLYLYENRVSIIYYAYSSVLFQITLVLAREWAMKIINIIVNK